MRQNPKAMRQTENSILTHSLTHRFLLIINDLSLNASKCQLFWPVWGMGGVCMDAGYLLTCSMEDPYQGQTRRPWPKVRLFQVP